MRNNSRNIYMIFGNDKKKEIDQFRLSFQHKLIHSNLNSSNLKPRIFRNLTGKQLREKFLSKNKSISPKTKENLITNNKFLQYKKLSTNRNQFGSISTKNSINLTYQEKPKILSNYNNAISNLKQKGSIFRYKQKNKNCLNSYNEKLMPVISTERKERTKVLSKNELNVLSKTKKSNKIIRKFQPEAINYIKKNNSRNISETSGNINKKEINENKLVFHHLNLYNLYNPSIKSKIHKSISTNILNKYNLNLLNNNSEFTKFYTNRDKSDSIPTRNSISNTINNLKQKKTPKKRKKIFKENSKPLRTEISRRVHGSLLNIVNEAKKVPIKIKDNPKEKINNFIYNNKINELEKENQKLKEEINKLKKELNNKNEIINQQQLKIKEQESTIEYIKINNNREMNKLKDKIGKIKSIIPFEIFPGEKIMPIIFKSDDQNILYSVLCKNTDKFTRLKSIIYDNYPEYKEYENYFLFNGEKINELKTLDENKIKDGSIITIYSKYD